MKRAKRLAALCAAFLLSICTLSVAVHAAQAPMESAGATALPPGTGKVAEVYTDETGRKFYTIQTPAGNTFYLIIDFAKQSENVYFLDAVSEKDLIALAEKEGSVVSPQMENSDSDTTEPSSEPVDDTVPEQPKAGNNSLFHMILIVVVVVIGGGVGLYFTITRKKRSSHSSNDEYEEEEYIPEEPETDIYDGNMEAETDLPPWEDDNDEFHE